MMKIHEDDQYNDCYGRERMYLALQQRKAAGKTNIDIPCEATVRKVMAQIGLIHKPRRKPNGITKADRLAQKSDDLLRRDFYADRPLKKAVIDISEVKAKDGKLYISAIFDCFDLMPLGIAIEDNMRASLCCHTLENASKSYPDIKGCIIHSDRGSQYTSEEYRAAVKKYGIIQSDIDKTILTTNKPRWISTQTVTSKHTVFMKHMKITLSYGITVNMFLKYQAT